MTKREAILDIINKSWTTEEIVNAWNHVCEYYDTLEDKVWEVNGQNSSDIENRCVLVGDDFAEASSRSMGSYFDPDDKYFWFDIDNEDNLIVRSGDWPDSDNRSPINKEDIVDFIIETGEYAEKINGLALYYIVADKYYPGDTMGRNILFDMFENEMVDLVKDNWNTVVDEVECDIKTVKEFIAEHEKYRKKSMSGEA
jgi:hypothetical protein